MVKKLVSNDATRFVPRKMGLKPGVYLLKGK
jgi:hypothetical protein